MARGGFGPTVLAGLATAGAAAVAATRAWYDVDGPSSTLLPGTTTGADSAATFPAASALSLVLLASWGVLLVTRGGVRRVFALLALLAATALVGAVMVAWLDRPEGGVTGWFWVGAATALLAVAPALLAVSRVGQWPEMGRRYDSPAGAPDEQVTGDRDLWRSLDEGHDPTVRKDPPTDP